jgi:hypothetical protein
LTAERITGRCPADDSYMLSAGGFSSDTHQTEAFTYYCVRCKAGYTYIRPLTAGTFEVLQWVSNGLQGFGLTAESRLTAERFRPDLMEKCKAALAGEAASFRKYRGLVPQRCPLDSWELAPADASFLLDGGSRMVRVTNCPRCGHFHCYGEDPDFGWEYLVSITVDAATSNYVVTTQRTTDTIAGECVRGIRMLVARRGK